ncbi:MAG: HD domain-containing protein [Microcoleaceae cyanobacterium]
MTKYYPTQITERFDKALLLCCQLHRHQIRKDGRTPYVAHLLAVAALVLEDGGSEDEAIAALLHDSVEDQGGLEILEKIKRDFGENVAKIVAGCTESETFPKPPWKERKSRYLQQIRTGLKAVQRVSLADKLHNARCLLLQLQQEGKAVWQQFRGGKSSTLKFYKSLLSSYRIEGNMKQEFEKVIHQLEKF